MIAILGAGESGVGAALLAQAKGLEVFVSDKGEIKPVYQEKLQAANIPFEAGSHDYARILSATEIIKSPGIPDKADLIQQAKAKNIPVISEIEFASRYTQAKFIGITGTNGKTTTTLLTFHLLQSAGLNVALAGNIGESLAEKVIKDEHDYYVVELSSFQLDGMYQFKAHIGILLNITPDHLDRYEYSMANYAQSKLRIAQNMTQSDYFIYNLDDAVTNEYFNPEDFKGQAVPFSINQKPAAKAFYEGTSLITTYSGSAENIETRTSVLIGKHNQYNTAAAVLAARLVGIEPEEITAALATFKNADHRLQTVGEANGVRYINDSKATNVEAVWYALDGITQPIVWIAGGVDKGNDYTSLKALAQEKIKALICLGVDNKKLVESFSGIIPVIHETQSVEEAINLTKEAAVPGDVVLLSPACASFDLFNNYEHRGKRFAEAVQHLVLEPLQQES
ncbi:UDP-N-acetylmuramoyl-L-alanine--D-glutamate ligase [Adhaeribacter pallidiroseus]|uniref:UDP-N-acetylmuramoylalanine--D-glutamate ligase n=1 Tax=Adhaeribacter pallidiroseus TaxID=2072847 RepID=A0A369QCT2_9BACT|nr:UDP-N-acetylmuramoyl-L-alanine--D-glutamate ligase [Adhaeribacter pallidiroseus]RDC62242.1 UDP-N-acetylmuramoyl-L-alanine--D-glutamate ligase [Adhaeribacter pallidiroseus]